MVDGNKNCPEETETNAPGDFKSLHKFSSMHRNVTFEVLQLFSQTIKENKILFLDCSFG